MKICTKCQIPQPLENFYDDKSKKDGKVSQCKLCHKKYREENKEKIALKKRQYREDNKRELLLKKKQYHEQNREVILLKKKRYYQEHKEEYKQYAEENKEQIALKNKHWRENNKEIITLKQKQRYEDNKEQYALKAKQHREENKESIRLDKKRYRENNKEIIVLKKKRWYEENKEKAKLKAKQWKKTPLGQINNRNANHKRRTITKQGDVTNDQLKELLESSINCFYCNNPLVLNEIHVDHYIPLAKGGLHTITNLRVACKKCNIQKSDQMPEEFTKMLNNDAIKCWENLKQLRVIK